MSVVLVGFIILVSVILVVDCTFRGPACPIDGVPPLPKLEEDRDGDGDTFWNDDTFNAKGQENRYAQNPGADAYAKTKGFDTFYNYCCAERARECGKTGDCDKRCNRPVQSRLRFALVNPVSRRSNRCHEDYKNSSLD